VTVSAAKIAPTVATPAVAPILSNQALPLTIQVEVAAGYQIPTGTVTAASGSYTSASVALVDGAASVTIPAGKLAAGTDTLKLSYMPDPGSSAIYTSATGSESVTVTQAPTPSFTLSGTAVTVLPGATTGNTSTVTLTPADGFTGAVTLSAAITASPTGAQDLPTVSFGSTSSVNITGAASGKAVLTVSTTPAGNTASLDSHQRPWLPAGGGVFAAALLLCFRVKRRRWLAMTAVLAFSAIVLLGMEACGGGGNGGSGQVSPGTTAGAYTVTVTGTSGAESQTAVVKLTVE
jgi:hypothetical protein